MIATLQQPRVLFIDDDALEYASIYRNFKNLVYWVSNVYAATSLLAAQIFEIELIIVDYLGTSDNPLGKRQLKQFKPEVWLSSVVDLPCQNTVGFHFVLKENLIKELKNKYE